MIEFIKAYPWTFAVGGLILLVAIVGVVVGVVTRGRWVDRGFMERDGHKLKWLVSDLPLVVIQHPALSLFWAKAYIAAVRRISEATGRHFFMLSLFQIDKSYDWGRSPPAGHVTLRLSDDEDGHTKHKYERDTGRILSAEVSVPEDAKYMVSLMLHELCHALGLDHDESTSSIMYPTLESGRAPGELSEADIKRLRRY